MQNQRQMLPQAFPAMVDPVPHRFAKAFMPQQALRNGTLFPELYKPMREACSSGQTSLRKGQAIAFAAWEMRLYLNTHPDDDCALALYNDLCQQADQPNYACTFAGCTRNGWQWIEDPWPWEYEANERRA